MKDLSFNPFVTKFQLDGVKDVVTVTTSATLVFTVEFNQILNEVYMYLHIVQKWNLIMLKAHGEHFLFYEFFELISQKFDFIK